MDWQCRIGRGLRVAVLLALPVVSGAAEIPRTPEGRPDLTGFYDVTTATPLERHPRLGNRKAFTDAEAAGIVQRLDAAEAAKHAASDPDRPPPPVGGLGNRGNPGTYNAFYLDARTAPIRVDGEYRTSIIVDPENGRMPARTPQGTARLQAFFHQHRNYESRAWWLDQPGPGPFDDPESLTTVDRCLLGRGVPGGPPMLPTIYNNMKRIVQTPDHVMILIEMVHDARIIRLNSEHVDPSIRKWLGDSIGWWEGDTLVVETTNFNDSPSLTGASRHLKVVERFERVDADTIMYRFTVEDPDTWAAPWSGEYPWRATADLVYEYACHEGNYAMESILRGARLLEKEALGVSDGDNRQD
jgi:hypothetical protein